VFVLLIIMAIVMILAYKAKTYVQQERCKACGSTEWDTSGHNEGYCWSCSDLLDEDLVEENNTLHYHCGDCRNMHDPCGDCWELIDKGQHPQQPIKHRKEIIQKMIDHNAEGFRKIAHSDHKGSRQEQDLQAQRQNLFEQLWELEDAN
jgi:hypothetical protein